MNLSVCQENYANEQCLYKKKPSCFYFYLEDLIALSEFCAECKLNFASSPDFNLKRVKI